MHFPQTGSSVAMASLDSKLFTTLTWKDDSLCAICLHEYYHLWQQSAKNFLLKCEEVLTQVTTAKYKAPRLLFYSFPWPYYDPTPWGALSGYYRYFIEYYCMQKFYNLNSMLFYKWCSMLTWTSNKFLTEPMCSKAAAAFLKRGPWELHHLHSSTLEQTGKGLHGSISNSQGWTFQSRSSHPLLLNYNTNWVKWCVLVSGETAEGTLAHVLIWTAQCCSCSTVWCQLHINCHPRKLWQTAS